MTTKNPESTAGAPELSSTVSLLKKVGTRAVLAGTIITATSTVVYGDPASLVKFAAEAIPNTCEIDATASGRVAHALEAAETDELAGLVEPTKFGLHTADAGGALQNLERGRSTAGVIAAINNYTRPNHGFQVGFDPVVGWGEGVAAHVGERKAVSFYTQTPPLELVREKGRALLLALDNTPVELSKISPLHDVVLVKEVKLPDTRAFTTKVLDSMYMQLDDPDFTFVFAHERGHRMAFKVCNFWRNNQFAALKKAQDGESPPSSDFERQERTVTPEAANNASEGIAETTAVVVDGTFPSADLDENAYTRAQGRVIVDLLETAQPGLGQFYAAKHAKALRGTS